LANEDVLPVKPEMILIQGGKFPIGSVFQSQVVLEFWIGKYELTWEEWKTIREWARQHGYDLGAVGYGSDGKHPVHSVDWCDAVKWCNAKSEMEGLEPVYLVNESVYRYGQFGIDGSMEVEMNIKAKGYRLPTDTEWEWAARGGVSSRGCQYSGSNELPEVGWFRDNSIGSALNPIAAQGTWQVGCKHPNELSLYDMSGNIAEWCWASDWTPRLPLQRMWQSFQRKPNGLSKNRSLRGGAWHSGAEDSLVSAFNSHAERDRTGIGFRLSRSGDSKN
jgi:formylglycine-generating enzyme required for sulfatase activity